MIEVTWVNSDLKKYSWRQCMKDRDFQKILSELDEVRGEWETRVCERLDSFEIKHGITLDQIDDERKNEFLQRMGWLEESIRLLKIRFQKQFSEE